MIITRKVLSKEIIFLFFCLTTVYKILFVISFDNTSSIYANPFKNSSIFLSFSQIFSVTSISGIEGWYAASIVSLLVFESALAYISVVCMEICPNKSRILS